MQSLQKDNLIFKPIRLNESSKVIISKIPDSWEILKLKEITEPITKGTTPTTEGFNYMEKGINFFRVENIDDNGKIDLINCYYISEENHKSFLRSQLKENDILFSLAGSLGRVALIKKSMIPANINQALGIVRLKKKEFDHVFLEYLLRSFILQKQVNIEKTIGAQPNISLTQLGNFKIIKPPFKVQQKIASILLNVYELIQKTDHIIEQTQRLKKGLMQRLLTKGIGHTKFKKIKFNFGKLLEIPHNWECKELSEVVKFRQGLQIAKVQRYKEPGNNRLKLIKVWDFNLENEKDHEYVDIPQKSRESVVCKKDDIIIARTGTLGLVMTNVEGVFHNNTFALDYDKKILSKMFFYNYLQIQRVQQFIKIISTRTSQSDLTHREFSKLIVFIPPKGEQERIEIFISKINDLLDKIISEKNQLESLKKGLMQKLLTGKIRVKV